MPSFANWSMAEFHGTGTVPLPQIIDEEEYDVGPPFFLRAKGEVSGSKVIRMDATISAEYFIFILSNFWVRHLLMATIWKV